MFDEIATSPGIDLEQRYTRATNAASGAARRAMTFVDNSEIGNWIEIPVEVTEQLGRIGKPRSLKTCGGGGGDDS